MKNYKEIQGWFTHTRTYDFLVNTIPDGGTFVECGAWLGKSSAYLCSIANDRINVFIVDSWKGSKDEITHAHKLATETDIHEIFTKNLEGYKYIPLKLFSHQAVELFQDNSCDVVFIDMGHTYEEVKNDIEIWLPKIKNGGYISGHDYNHGWPGVWRAVNEKFGEENIVSMEGQCWIYKVET